MESERIIKERGLWEKLAPNYDKQTAIYEKAYRLSIEKAKQVLKKNLFEIVEDCTLHPAPVNYFILGQKR